MDSKHDLNTFYELLKADRKFSPWSKEQTVHSRFEKLVGEVEELREAFQENDPKHIKEEF